MLISFVAPSNLYRDMRPFTLYNGTFPVCRQQRTGACKCHVIVVVFRLRVQKLTPAELRLFAKQCGSTITLNWKHLEEVDNFIYLGATVSKNCGAAEDKKRRRAIYIGLVRNAFNKLSKTVILGE